MQRHAAHIPLAGPRQHAPHSKHKKAGSHRAPNLLCRWERVSGFTLLELCIVLMITASLATIAYPRLESLILNTKATAHTNHLISLLQFGRLQALQHRIPVTICHLKEGTCQKPWQNQITIFTDYHPVGHLDATDRVLMVSSLPTPEVVIFWRSFRRKPYLRFLPFGGTNHQNGHFLICLKPDINQGSRKVIVNHMGRTRVDRPRKRPERLGSKPKRIC
jgi:type IV fimbrial biogenesis protein FimT